PIECPTTCTRACPRSGPVPPPAGGRAPSSAGIPGAPSSAGIPGAPSSAGIPGAPWSAGTLPPPDVPRWLRTAAATSSAIAAYSTLSVHGEAPWLGRSTRSERKSGSRPRAIDWKFLPCPNSPCRNTTYGPDPPTSVTDSSLTPTSLGAPPAHPPDRGTPHEPERGETLRPAHPGTTVRGALDGRRATEHVLVRCARPPPRPASARRLADDLAQVGVREVARALVELVRVPVLVVQRDVLHRVLAR